MKAINNVRKVNKIDWFINILAILFILGSFVTVIRIWALNRSFWVDESMLVWSFNTSSLRDILKNGLKWDQSAPWGYAFLVKIVMKLLGNAEMTLRLTSIIAFLLMLFMVYKLAKEVFDFKYPLICVAFIPCNQILIQYTNEFKPYMLDCLCTSLVIYLFFLREKRMNVKVWILTNIVLILTSNPACFVLAAILLYDFGNGILKKDKEKIVSSIKTGLLFLIIFIIYYLLWLKKVTNNEYMIQYWEQKKIPLLLITKENWKQLFSLLGELFSVWGINKIFVILFSIVTLVMGIIKKNKYVLIPYISMFIAALASHFGFFPVAIRLWLFIYPILSLMAFKCLFDCLKTDIYIGKIMSIVVMFGLIIQNTGLTYYSNIDVAYYKGEEANTLIKYVQDNIKKNEKLYISYWGIPILSYKNGYNNNGIGRKNQNNIIYGTKNFDYENDFSEIVNSNNCYIILYHEDRRDTLQDTLQKYGYLETIKNDHETYLYYFTKDKNNIKTSLNYKLDKITTYNGKCYLNITVHNTGEAYINTDYSPVGIRSRDYPDIIIDIPQNIKPKESITFTCSFDWNDKDNLNLEFVNTKYWYDEIGVDGFEVTKKDDYKEAKNKFEELKQYLTKNNIIIIAGKDDFSASWNEQFQHILEQLGLKKSLYNVIQYSYVGIIDGGDRVYEKLDNHTIKYQYKSKDCQINVESKGFNCGDNSSIKINGKEYSINQRGLNIVVYNNEKKEVVDNFAIDTNLNYSLSIK